jgi:hypothetical protein
MSKHLIFEDTKNITEHLKLLENTQPVLQDIVNEIVNTGVTPTLTDIQTLVSVLRSFSEKQQKEYVTDYLRDKLIDTVPNPQIGGLKINNEALKNLIEVSDCTELLKHLETLYQKIHLYWRGYFDFKYYTLNQKVIEVSGIGKQLLTERFRVYTSDKGLEVYNVVKQVVDNLELLEDKIHVNSLYKDAKMNIAPSFKFLRVENGKWLIDYNYIARIE